MKRLPEKAIFGAVCAALLNACSGGAGTPNGGADAAPSATVDPSATTPGDGAGGAPVVIVPGELGGSGSDVVPHATRFARLTHPQWENTVRELLHLDAAPGLSLRFTGDTTQGIFDNNSASLKVTDGLQQDYAQASAELAARVVADPHTFAALLPVGLPASGPERDRGFVEGFGARAFRRPLTEVEVARITTLFSQGAELVASGDPFRDGVQLTIEASRICHVVP